MSKIKNEPICKEDYVQKVRGAMQHRAQWLYLLVDEAKKQGQDWEAIARAATTRCTAKAESEEKAEALILPVLEELRRRFRRRGFPEVL